MDLEDPTSVTLAVAAALEGAGIEAAVYGGLALAAYGEPRETKHADFAVVGVEGVSVHDVLVAAGLGPSLSFEGVRFGGNDITRFALFGSTGTTGVNVVDLVRPRSMRYARCVLDRSLTGTLRDQAVRLVAPEDFVLLKILSTRDRDIEDAQSVVASIGARLELSLIREELARLEVEIAGHDIRGRCARVLGAAGP